MQDSLQGIRLSPQQKRLWLLQGDDGGYCAQAAVLMIGPINPSALQDAVERVLARHEIFRTTFRREAGVKVPFQVIGEDRALRWRTVDMRERGLYDQEADLAVLAGDQRRRPFLLEQGPLFDVVLVLCAERRSVLLLCLPALCADAITLHNLVREISTAYGVEGEPAEEPVQYVQFSEWQNELLVEEEAEKGTQYWHQLRLAETRAVILPCEEPASRMVETDNGSRFCSVRAPLHGKVAAGLEEAARIHSTSLMVILFACWQALLFRLTNHADVLVAILGDGRKFEELHGTMGLLAKWMPVRCHIEATEPFTDLVSRARAAVGEVLQWQEYYVGESSEGPAGTALADPVGFEYDVLPPACQAGDLSFLLADQTVRFDRWKLKLACQKSPEGLLFDIHYDASRFSKDYVASLTAQFSALVKSVAKDSQVAVGDLEILGDVERRRLLSAMNDTAVERSGEECLHQLFEASAKQDPEGFAVVCGERPMTYAELNARANQLAHLLIRRGVGPEVLVALCMERSVEMLIGVLGILKAGGAYVPLDPGNARSRLAYEMTHAGAPVIITQEALLPLLPDLDATVVCLERDRPLLDRESSTDPGRAVSPHHIAYVIYTSGSTGVPKGVAVTHQNAVNYTRNIHRRVGAERGWRFATVSTIGADLGNTVIFASWVSGGYLHVIDYGTATNGRLFADYVAHHPIDVLKIVPSHLSALLGSSDGRNVLPRKILILGGEALSVELAEQVAKLSDCQIMNHYGPTETTIGCLTFPWVKEQLKRLSSSTVPIGRPIANTDVYILDEHLRQVPVGVPGELYIGGMGLARGYLRSPEQTAERFLPHPFSTVPGSRLYKSGDLVRCWPDCALEYLGRLDHQVKIRGYRVELGEIEAHLLEHREVREVVVMARQDSSDEKRLVAYVVPRSGGGVDVAALRRYLEDRIPEYMVPSAFVCLAAFPLTSNGKVNRQQLPPPDTQHHLRTPYVAPRNAAERILVEIWTDLLKVPNIGVDDNFFDLGGHSLLAIQLLHRVQRSVGHRLSLTAIFHAPTVAKLAGLISSASAPASSPMVVLQESGPGYPLYCFDPTGRHLSAYQAIADHLRGKRPVYGLDLGYVFHQDWNDASIHRIAEDYANAIRQAQGTGPYYLLGWSLGGVMAVAVAREMEKLNQQVAFLGIIDTQARVKLYEEKVVDVLDELEAFLHGDRRDEFRALPDSERGALRSRLMALPPEERVEHAGRWAMEKGFLPKDVPIEMLKLRYTLLKDAATLLGAQECPLTAPIHAWWATMTVGPGQQPLIDWSRYTTGTVANSLIPGDHFGLTESAEFLTQIAGTLADLDGAYRK